MLIKARFTNLCLGLFIAIMGFVAPRSLAAMLKEVVQELDAEGLFEGLKNNSQ